MNSEKMQAEFGDAVEIRSATELDGIDGVLPVNIAAPRDENAAIALVTWCGKNDVAFIPRGGGTKLHVGARPARCDLVISTEHLNGVVEHDEGNATVQAGSGITLAALNQAVGARGQFVPFGWSYPTATLGGIVATNYSDATKLRYAAPRDLVVGLHVVLSDGRFVKAGSKVVKNVSGYDLNKLFIGSFGTLGLITEVTIRLRPNDAVQSDWLKSFATFEDAEAAAQQIFNGPFEPALLRIIAEKSRVRLHARFDGGVASVSAQLARLPKTDEIEVPGPGESSDLELLAQLPVARASAWAKTALASGATRVFWDCGLGAVRAGWGNAPENTAALVETLRNAALKSEGSLVAERAPQSLKTPDFIWGAPRSDFVLMQSLKKTLDPANLSSPGCFMGGI